ncbi:ATP-binding protein [Streptomyces adustus]|uniref:ATP-binding protein n=1 Tax=Streptomyces adustus TaxID=1609272 RepID=UPI003721195C
MLTKWLRLFPGLPQQVAEARYFVAALMEAEGPRAVDDAVLITSELASNAVRHSRSGRQGGWFGVSVRFEDDRIRIEVIDEGGDNEPQLLDATEQQEGGRGLLMMAALAKDWGVNERLHGRSVWADLARAGA